MCIRDSLNDALERRAGKARVEREHGIAVVPAAFELLCEGGPARHSEGHETAHAKSVRGSPHPSH